MTGFLTAHEWIFRNPTTFYMTFTAFTVAFENLKISLSPLTPYDQISHWGTLS